MIQCEKYDRSLADYERESSISKITSTHNCWKVASKKSQKLLSSRFLYRVPEPSRPGLREQSWFCRLLFKSRWLKILKIESLRCDLRTCFKKESEWKEVSDELSLLTVCVHSTDISIWANVPRLTHSRWNKILVYLDSCIASSGLLETSVVRGFFGFFPKSCALGDKFAY